MSDTATQALDIAQAPAAVRRAFAHVQEIHPSVTRVHFDNEDGFYRWSYSDSEGNAPAFSENVDVSLLEDALDAVEVFPVAYEVCRRMRRVIAPSKEKSRRMMASE